MKLILTGATGFIGGEVLKQCVESPTITSVVVLSRRALPPAQTKLAKLKVVLMQDFFSYSNVVLQEIKGADACIWCLGQVPSKARTEGSDATHKICLDFTLTAARAFCQNTSAPDKKLRFVYLSGGAAERDQTRSLWFGQEYRKMRGQVENELIAHAKDNETAFEAYIMRPGMVLASHFTVKDLVRSMLPSVKVDHLASKMLGVAEKGGDRQIFENDDINRL